jgi:hypothetical protein
MNATYNYNEQIQNLLNMKFELYNIDSQFNTLMNQIQNIGIITNIDMQINNISLQILNFGIRLLNLGMKLNNKTNYNYNTKEQIDNIRNQLNNISMNFYLNDNMNMDINQNFQENEMPSYNVVFEENGVRETLSWKGNITIYEMIIKYRIKKIGYFNEGEINRIMFLFNAKNLNDSSNRNKTVNMFFNPREIPKVNVVHMSG